MTRLTSPVGRSIFQSLDCLPQAKDQAERHRFRALVTRFFSGVHGEAPGGLAENPYKKEIDNTVAWVMKYLDMFPPGNLRYFVRNQPVPAGGGGGGGRAAAGPSGAGS